MCAKRLETVVGRGVSLEISKEKAYDVVEVDIQSRAREIVYRDGQRPLTEEAASRSSCCAGMRHRPEVQLVLLPWSQASHPSFRCITQTSLFLLQFLLLLLP